MEKLVKGVFIVIGSTTIALLLYYNLFGYNGNVGGIVTACRNAEKPISLYFKNYGLIPSEGWDRRDGLPGGVDYFGRAQVERSWTVSY